MVAPAASNAMCGNHLFAINDRDLAIFNNVMFSP
jgi:hypothetical protein